MSRRISGVLSLLVLLAVLVSGCAGGGSSEPYAVSGRVVDTEGNGVEGVLLQFSGGRTAVLPQTRRHLAGPSGAHDHHSRQVGWAFDHKESEGPRRECRFPCCFPKHLVSQTQP